MTVARPLTISDGPHVFVNRGRGRLTLVCWCGAAVALGLERALQLLSVASIPHRAKCPVARTLWRGLVSDALTENGWPRRPTKGLDMPKSSPFVSPSAGAPRPRGGDVINPSVALPPSNIANSVSDGAAIGRGDLPKNDAVDAAQGNLVKAPSNAQTANEAVEAQKEDRL